jgi:hypothetical protein
MTEHYVPKKQRQVETRSKIHESHRFSYILYTVDSDLDEVCLRGIPMYKMIDLIQGDGVVVLNKEDFLKDCHQAIDAFSNKMDGLFAPNIKGENE